MDPHHDPHGVFFRAIGDHVRVSGTRYDLPDLNAPAYLVRSPLAGAHIFGAAFINTVLHRN